MKFTPKCAGEFGSTLMEISINAVAGVDVVTVEHPTTHMIKPMINPKVTRPRWIANLEVFILLLLGLANLLIFLIPLNVRVSR
jgi:hypothetical protein